MRNCPPVFRKMLYPGNGGSWHFAERAHWREAGPLGDTVNGDSLEFIESGEPSPSATHLAGRVAALQEGRLGNVGTQSAGFNSNFNVQQAML